MYSAVRLHVVVPVGVYVDRFDRRTILWITNLSRAALLVMGILETAADNAALSILPSVVPANKLDQANSRISAAQLVADEFAGPPLGGFLFALGVAVPVLAADGASWLRGHRLLSGLAVVGGLASVAYMMPFSGFRGWPPLSWPRTSCTPSCGESAWGRFGSA